jgi:hypothetical protein
MEDLILVVQQWVSTDVLIGLMIASIVGFIGSLIAIPWILIRLPSDYFDLRVPRYWMKDHHPALRLIGLILKNIAGAIFLIAGFLMLFLPGQGLLTMLIGISFIDFPGKRRLEAKIVGQRTILHAINTMRSKFNKPPLTLSPTDC